MTDIAADLAGRNVGPKCQAGPAEASVHTVEVAAERGDRVVWNLRALLGAAATAPVPGSTITYDCARC
ncbi:MAG TPA: hypothetical protein VIV06_12420 [Candidatus Limnocylindrales bacterium]